MSFRRRTYQEVLDNLLTGLAGGVSAETHAFPPSEADAPPYSYPLQRTAVTDVVSVYGSRNGQSHLFGKNADYALSEDGETLQWIDGGQTPDEGSVFAVNYIPEQAIAAANDIYVGSVLRTITETVGLEMARLYAELEGVYQSGFVDTASGSALDNVVSLLGVVRTRAGRFSGTLEFTRAAGSHGEIYLPAGTRVMTTDGNVEYETTATATLVEGQVTVKVGARDVEENSQGVGAGELSVLAKPIAGIASVTNPSPTAAADADETDTELRTRAKNFLHGSERATLGSLTEAMSRQGVTAEVEELVDTEGHRTGEVEIIPHVESLSPELRQRLLTAIQDTRPAGVNVRLKEGLRPPKRIDLSIRVVTSADLPEQDLRAAQDSVESQIADYFAGLSLAEQGSVNRVIGMVLGVPEIQDMEILSAKVSDGPDLPTSGQFGTELEGSTKVLGSLEIIDPNLPSRLQIVVSYPEDADPPDQAAIDTAFNDMINYINEANAVATPVVTELSFGALAYVLPLPGLDHGLLSEVVSGTAPPLPVQADLAQAGYTPQFIFTQESGLSQTVQGDTDAYPLSAFERLSYSGAELSVEAADG